MVAQTNPQSPPVAVAPPVVDQIIVLRDVSWGDYQRLLEIRGDRSVPRLTYLEGQLELMSPSRPHESIKSVIGCLVEAYCLDRDIEFRTVGSWTLEDKEAERGVEPDECWIFGEEDAHRPHVAVEVVWTSGGLDKLAVYRRLGVQEVWFWIGGELTAWALRGQVYEPLGSVSEVLPGIDLPQLASFLDRPSTSQAIRDYRAALSG